MSDGYDVLGLPQEQFAREGAGDMGRVSDSVLDWLGHGRTAAEAERLSAEWRAKGYETRIVLA